MTDFSELSLQHDDDEDDDDGNNQSTFTAQHNSVKERTQLRIINDQVIHDDSNKECLPIDDIENYNTLVPQSQLEKNDYSIGSKPNFEKDVKIVHVAKEGSSTSFKNEVHEKSSSLSKLSNDQESSNKNKTVSNCTPGGQVSIEYTTEDKLFSQVQSGSSIQLSSSPLRMKWSEIGQEGLAPTLLENLSHHALHQSIYQIALLLDQLMGHLKDIASQICGVQSIILRPLTPQPVKLRFDSLVQTRVSGGGLSSVHRQDKGERKLSIAEAWYWMIVEVLSRLHIPDTNRKRTAEHVKGRLQSLVQDSAELVRFILSIQESLEEGRRRFARVISISKVRLRSQVWKFVGSTSTSASVNRRLRKRKIKKSLKLKHLYSLNIPQGERGENNQNQNHQADANCSSVSNFINPENLMDSKGTKTKNKDHLICWRLEDGLSLFEQKIKTDEQTNNNNNNKNRNKNVLFPRLKFSQRLDVFDKCVSEVHQLIQKVILRMEKARDFLTPLGGLSSLTALSKMSKDVNELSAHLVRRKDTTLWLYHVESHVINQLVKTNKKIEQLCKQNMYNVQFIQSFQSSLEKLLKRRKTAVLGQFKFDERINIIQLYGQVQLKFSNPLSDLAYLFDQSNTNRCLVEFSKFETGAPKTQEQDETAQVQQSNLTISKTNKSVSKSLTTISNYYSCKPSNLEYYCPRSEGQIAEMTAENSKDFSTPKQQIPLSLVKKKNNNNDEIVDPLDLKMSSKYIKLYHDAGKAVGVHLREMKTNLEQVKSSLFLPINQNVKIGHDVQTSSQNCDIRFVEITTWFWIIARALQSLDHIQSHMDDSDGEKEEEKTTSNTPSSNSSTEFDSSRNSENCIKPNNNNYNNSKRLPTAMKKEIRRDLKYFVKSIPQLCNLIRMMKEEFKKIQMKVFKLENKCINFQVPIISHCPNGVGGTSQYNQEQIMMNGGESSKKNEGSSPIKSIDVLTENRQVMSIILNSAGISISYKGAVLSYENCPIVTRGRLLRCFLRRMNEQVHRAISLCTQIHERLKGEIMDSQFKTLGQLLDDLIGNVKEMKRKSIVLSTTDHSVAKACMLHVEKGLTAFDLMLKYLVEQSVGVKEEIALLPLTLKLVVDSETSGSGRLKKLFRYIPFSRNFLMRQSYNRSNKNCMTTTTTCTTSDTGLSHVTVIVRENEIKMRRQIEEIMCLENAFPNKTTNQNNTLANTIKSSPPQNIIDPSKDKSSAEPITIINNNNSQYLTNVLILKSHKIQELVFSHHIKWIASELNLPNAAYNSAELRVSKINALGSMISNGILELIFQNHVASLLPYKEDLLKCLEEALHQGNSFLKEVTNLLMYLKKFQNTVDPQLEKLIHWIVKGRVNIKGNHHYNHHNTKLHHNKIVNTNDSVESDATSNNNNSAGAWNVILSKLESVNNNNIANRTGNSGINNNLSTESGNSSIMCTISWMDRNQDLVFQPSTFHQPTVEPDQDQNPDEHDENESDKSNNNCINQSSSNVSFSALNTMERFSVLKDLVHSVTEIFHESSKHLTHVEPFLKVAQNVLKDMTTFVLQNMSQNQLSSYTKNTITDEIKRIWLEISGVFTCLENFRTIVQKLLHDVKVADDVFRLKLTAKIEEIFQWNCPHDGTECDSYIQSFATKSKAYSKICQLRSQVKSLWFTPVRVDVYKSPIDMEKFKVNSVDDFS